jgi:heme/copper-type cytochrome/quinol oxidase subunit 2
MPGDHTPLNPVDDYSGVRALPPFQPYQPAYQQWHPDPLISRDSWIRIVMWVIPIIFTAGALFVSVKSMTQRQDEQEAALRAEVERRTRLESEQRIMQSTVHVMSGQQERLVTKVEVIDEKLNEQKSQLSAIGERIGVRARQK